MAEVQESILFGSHDRRALELRGVVQSYAWGKVGASSRIASIVGSYGVDQPLAEYWIGTHPKGPSMIRGEGGVSVSLLDAIRDNSAALLGAEIAQRYHKELPFLLKVLSINPQFALSIQAHPDEARARTLHARDPLLYPDPRHKPEVALPLSRVVLLYGFRPLSEIQAILARFPELLELLEPDLQAMLLSADAALSHEAVCLEQLSRSLFTSAPSAVAQVVGRLKERAQVCHDEELALVGRLARTYGDSDVGLVALFIMNLVEVNPGSALYIGPNVPHAYLDGDLVECMACSDNVVRAGLTSKPRDVETLLKMLDYVPRSAEIIAPRMQDDGFLLVDTPAAEFSVSFLPQGNGVHRLMSGARVSVLLALGSQLLMQHTASGAQLVLSDGGAALIPPGSGEYRLERSDVAVYVVSPQV
jgi:mannose-6-phosphate isomerase